MSLSHLASASFLKLRLQKVALDQKQKWLPRRWHSTRILEMSTKSPREMQQFGNSSYGNRFWNGLMGFVRMYFFHKMTGTEIQSYLQQYRLSINMEMVPHKICHFQQLYPDWFYPNCSIIIIQPTAADFLKEYNWLGLFRPSITVTKSICLNS